uniref:Uncharacterized protein n=1 Tax=viral metagenome TaxID=1070528 RepID=A0A6M3IHK6_9ZZZZ
MNITDLLIPISIVVAGLVILVVYTLTISIRDLCKANKKMCEYQVQINEKLLILLGARNGGDKTVHALASSILRRHPQKKIEGATGQSKEKNKLRPGFTMGVQP